MTAITDPLVLQTTVDWLKDFLRERHDVIFSKVIHRPPMWYFYGAEGDFVIKMEEDLMDRLYFALNRDSFTLGEPEEISKLIKVQDDRDDVGLTWDNDDDEAWEKS